MNSRVLLIFFSFRFDVTTFTLKSLINLDLSFVHGEGYGSIFNFSTYCHTVMPASFVKDAFVFLLYHFDIFVKKSGVHKYMN